MLIISQVLVKSPVEKARQAGYERIVLDSHISMARARELYQTIGFQKVKPPDDFPEDLKPHVVFMECELIDSPDEVTIYSWKTANKIHSPLVVSNS